MLKRIAVKHSIAIGNINNSTSVYCQKLLNIEEYVKKQEVQQRRGCEHAIGAYQGVDITRVEFVSNFYSSIRLPVNIAL